MGSVDEVLSDGQLLRVFALFAGEGNRGVLWQANPDGWLVVAVNCSDVFVWGFADAEPITPATLPVLESAHTDLERIGQSPEWLAELYAARVRGMRPQGAMYELMVDRDGSELHEPLVRLFDGCGPSREVAPGNPRPHPLP